MSQSSNKRLQFSINESIWLQDGERAEDILSMALEPDVAIEENGDFVAIKGALRLTGEYKPLDQPAIDAQEEDSNSHLAFRTIDEINETDEGTALIEHRFPVDIIVPVQKVANIEDLYVVIETFDYTLEENRRILLQGDIAITGLMNEKEKIPEASLPSEVKAPQESVTNRYPEIEQEEKQDYVSSIPFDDKPVDIESSESSYTSLSRGDSDNPFLNEFNLSLDHEVDKEEREEEQTKDDSFSYQDSFHFESHREPEKEKERENIQIELKKRDESKDHQPEEAEVSRIELKKQEESDVNQTEELEVSRSEQAGQNIPIPTPAPVIPVSEESTQKPAPMTQQVQPVPAPTTPPAQVEPIVEESKESTMAETEDTEMEPTKKEANALYLTKMLAGNEDEQFTKVRLCIVQHGDSLEGLSERFSVPITSILRRNKIDSNTLSEGQILYIPTKGK
ncbi:LysM peptidoglycan-binding domain-containing protein [Terrilactibacillus laevilacticus]|uniref:LysM peptidoglycan-binding domain-containing protein n=1 Tax=Terrilactibacillus laevilacticus TaxID=1380157 RepID=A0ABW5PT84_9BACI|nr:LysM peptidoglycan-binding domain-containing protein [Terrilactibacillus laevilacticus]